MSIADEITRLQTAKSDLKTAIEEKGVEVGDGTIDTYAQKVSEISSGGLENNPLEYANILHEAYKGVIFPDGYELTLNVPNVNDFVDIFRATKGIKKVVLKSENAENSVAFNYMFYQSANLETVDLTEFKPKLSGKMELCFTYTPIREILGEFDVSEVTSAHLTFNHCKNLVTVTPKANTINVPISFAQSPNLSDLSIQSIINGLADLTGGDTQTVTFHATVGAKLTNEQKATITAKNWELAY